MRTYGKAARSATSGAVAHTGSGAGGANGVGAAAFAAAAKTPKPMPRAGLISPPPAAAPAAAAAAAAAATATVPIAGAPVHTTGARLARSSSTLSPVKPAPVPVRPAAAAASTAAVGALSRSASVGSRSGSGSSGAGSDSDTAVDEFEFDAPDPYAGGSAGPISAAPASASSASSSAAAAPAAGASTGRVTAAATAALARSASRGKRNASRGTAAALKRTKSNPLASPPLEAALDAYDFAAAATPPPPEATAAAAATNGSPSKLRRASSAAASASSATSSSSASSAAASSARKGSSTASAAPAARTGTPGSDYAADGSQSQGDDAAFDLTQFTGASRAKLEHMQYLLDGIGPKSKVAVQHANALELATLLADSNNARLCRASGLFTQLFESLNASVCGADAVLRYAAVTAAMLVTADSTAARNLPAQCIALLLQLVATDTALADDAEAKLSAAEAKEVRAFLALLQHAELLQLPLVSAGHLACVVLSSAAADHHVRAALLKRDALRVCFDALHAHLHALTTAAAATNGSGSSDTGASAAAADLSCLFTGITVVTPSSSERTVSLSRARTRLRGCMQVLESLTHGDADAQAQLLALRTRIVFAATAVPRNGSSASNPFAAADAKAATHASKPLVHTLFAIAAAYRQRLLHTFGLAIAERSAPAPLPAPSPRSAAAAGLLSPKGARTAAAASSPADATDSAANALPPAATAMANGVGAAAERALSQRATSTGTLVLSAALSTASSDASLASTTPAAATNGTDGNGLIGARTPSDAAAEKDQSYAIRHRKRRSSAAASSGSNASAPQPQPHAQRAPAAAAAAPAVAVADDESFAKTQEQEVEADDAFAVPPARSSSAAADKRRKLSTGKPAAPDAAAAPAAMLIGSPRMNGSPGAAAAPQSSMASGSPRSGAGGGGREDPLGFGASALSLLVNLTHRSDAGAEQLNRACSADGQRAMQFVVDFVAVASHATAAALPFDATALMTPALGILINCADQSALSRQLLLASDAQLSRSGVAGGGQADAIARQPFTAFLCAVFGDTKRRWRAAQERAEALSSAMPLDAVVAATAPSAPAPTPATAAHQSVGRTYSRKAAAAAAAPAAGSSAAAPAPAPAAAVAPSTPADAAAQAMVAAERLMEAQWTCSYAATLLGCLLRHCPDARPAITKGLPDGLPGLSGVLRDFLSAQSDANVLTEDALVSLVEMVNVIENLVDPTGRSAIAFRSAVVDPSDLP